MCDHTFCARPVLRLRLALVLSALCLGLLLSGCLAGQQRGMAGSTYVSTSRPAVAVQAKEIPLATAGRGSGTLLRPSMTGSLSPTVRTAVYAAGADKPMAIIAHAELPSEWWIWTSILPRVGAIHEGTEVIDGVPFTAFTYLVPRRTDPYAGIAGEPVEAPEEARDLPEGLVDAYWLARYFAVRTNFNHDKIILEYREPAPKGLYTLSTIPYGMADALAAFEQRAREAFTLMPPAAVVQGPVQSGYPEGVRWRYMTDPFLGDVMLLEPMSRLD